VTDEELWQLGLRAFYVQPEIIQKMCLKRGWTYHDLADASGLSYAIIRGITNANIKLNPQRIETLGKAFDHSFTDMHDLLLGQHCQIPRWHYVVHKNGGERRSDFIDGTMFCAAKCQAAIPDDCPATCNLARSCFARCPREIRSQCECHRPTSPRRKDRFLAWVRKRMAHLELAYEEQRRIPKIPYGIMAQGATR